MDDTGTDRNLQDSDLDGIRDVDENPDLPGGTNPNIADTDGDGVRDGLEVALSRDPLQAEDRNALWADVVHYSPEFAAGRDRMWGERVLNLISVAEQSAWTKRRMNLAMGDSLQFKGGGLSASLRITAAEATALAVRSPAELPGPLEISPGTHTLVITGEGLFLDGSLVDEVPENFGRRYIGSSETEFLTVTTPFYRVSSGFARVFDTAKMTLSVTGADAEIGEVVVWDRLLDAKEVQELSEQYATMSSFSEFGWAQVDTEYVRLSATAPPSLQAALISPNEDTDNDGLDSWSEFLRGTHIDCADSDGDSLPDSVESGDGVWVSPEQTGTDPLSPDSDGDGLVDNSETLNGDTPSDPNLSDTDGDGAGDAYELERLMPANVVNQDAINIGLVVYRPFDDPSETPDSVLVDGKFGQAGSIGDAPMLNLPVSESMDSGTFTISAWFRFDAPDLGPWIRV